MTSLLDRKRERFLANPDDGQAFQALEEDLFLAGAWDSVLEIYERRLAAPTLTNDASERARIHLRMGQVQQDRRGDPDRAIECYRRALSEDSGLRAALIRLRAIHTLREQWDVALQIAEVEAALPLRADERARVLAEMGAIWHDHLDDCDEAIAFYERALEDDPNEIDALEGAARAHQQTDRPARAAEMWDRVIAQQTGRPRAAALVERARLAANGLDQPEQAVVYYRRALTDDPHLPEALAAVIEEASRNEQWPLLADLCGRQFEIEDDAARRLEIALDMASLHVDHIEDPNTARVWLERAAEIDPDNPYVLEGLADQARTAGDDVALASLLERWIARLDGAAPAAALLELATLHLDSGQLERARIELEAARLQAPDDALVAETLCEVLGQLDEHEAQIEVLEHRASLARSEPTLCAGFLAEAASIWETCIADLDSASAAYRRAFEIDPTVAEISHALERIYRKTEAWDEMRAFLGIACEISPDGERPRYLCSLAALLGDRFDEPEGAVQLLEQVLTLEPDSAAAHRGLQALASKSGDQGAIIRAYEREAQITIDPGRLGYLVRELLPRLEIPQAALVWTRRWIEVAPESREAVAATADLLATLEQDDELVAMLERLDTLLPSAEQSANRRRLADVHLAAERIDDAIDAYRSALDADPNDLVALRALAQGLDSERRLPELVDIHHRILELVPDAERAAGLDALASLQAERLGDVNGAIETLGRLRSRGDAPEDVDERIEELLERSARYEELAGHLQARIASLAPGDVRAPSLQMRRARVLLEHLDRFDEAAGEFSEVLAASPHSSEASEGLEASLRAGGDSLGLAELLLDRMESTDDPEVRDRSAFERAEILEERLDAIDAALELFRDLARTASDPELRARAVERLEALFERSGDWEGLRRHLEASLDDDAEDDPSAHERLGLLYRDRLRNIPRAVDCFETATTIAPERADLWRVLAALYEEEGRVDDLVNAMEAEIATAPAPDRELTLRSRAAELSVHPLDERDRAGEHYERVLELDATHSAASDFLIAHWERKGDPESVVRLLELRLAALERRSGDAPDTPALRTSMRLRIAGLRALELDDLPGAIAALEPALAEVGPEPYVAEPLADLYQRAARFDELIDLCRSAADAVTEVDERASWNSRLGDALRAGGADREAADAYRRVLTDRPDDREAQTALRQLYRRLGENEPLARLLEVELSHQAGVEEIPVRLELAGLLEKQPGRRRDALLHLRRVLQLDPNHGQAVDHALNLTDALAEERPGTDSAETTLEFLATAIGQPRPRSDRAALLARRARLLDQPLGRREDAILAYRESLTLETSSEVLAALRGVLESQRDWHAVLDCIFQQARGEDAETRGALFERAVEIAWNELDPESTLPWLERLRTERPDDASVLSRIADIHRRAGRHEATLRAIEAQVSLIQDPGAARDLHLERARILADTLGCPGRAAAAVEAASRVAPDDAGVLRQLAELYRRLGRERERAGTLENLVSLVDPQEQISIWRELADLYGRKLADPQRASARLLSAVAMAPSGTPQRGDLLRELGDALRATRDRNSWASCAEEELSGLDPGAAVFEERRIELHRELAHAYEHELGRPDTALHHLRALADDPTALEGVQDVAAADSTLLRLLRIQGNWLELEQRLAAHLDERPEDPEGWLELARLRDERLRAPTRACEAYHQVLDRVPDDLDALRGLRSAAERLGRFDEVAKALEAELERAAPRESEARAALLRRLADLYWRRLESTTRASRCYAAALEAHPQDLEALRSLQNLLEAMEDWRGAADLYWSELEMLDAADPERRQWVALRAGELARDKLDDPERALRAFETAADARALPAHRLRELASLYERADDLPAFAGLLARWCEDPESDASADDYLQLARTLDSLGERGRAREWIERSVATDAGRVEAWDMAAELREAGCDYEGAASALSLAADLCDEHGACERLVRAAALTEESDPESALERLRTARHRDAGDVVAHARLAFLANRLGHFDEAVQAANRALDLSPEPGLLDAGDRLRVALAGGRAATALEDLESLTRCYGAALEMEPEHAEALAEYGDALAKHGDLARAREVLERRLAQSEDDPSRAAHQTIIARAHWEAGDIELAVEQLEAAIATERRFDTAHETLVALWESQDDLDRGVASLERWADVAGAPDVRAERLLRAADWEIQDGNRSADAERHLREVLDADPSALRAWESLADLLWHSDRAEQTLEVASLALEGVEGASTSRVLPLLAGRALERLDRRDEAADKFATAAEADPTCVEAALSRARLMRGLGDWEGAADALRAFAENHYGNDQAGLSEVLQQLGRLLAGPLEDVEGAIAVYRRAITLDPDRLDLHESLAAFLSQSPAHWQEALAHHQWVLAAAPDHAATLRVLVRVARERGNAQALATGLGIARALEITSPADELPVSSETRPRFAGAARLANPLWESLREIAQESAREISLALQMSDPPPRPAESDPLAAFRATAFAIEGDLTAPALLPLTTREVGEVLTLIAALAVEPDDVKGEGRLVNALSSAFKRRSRRRLRRLLDGADLRSIESIDFEAWRGEVRALAHAQAVDQTGIELHDALLAVCEAERPGGSHDSATTDRVLSTRSFDEHPAARALLRRAVASWLDQL